MSGNPLEEVSPVFGLPAERRGSARSYRSDVGRAPRAQRRPHIAGDVRDSSRVSTSATPRPDSLTLRADDVTVTATTWAGPLIALGARLARRHEDLATDKQIVVALSLPARDFAAVLIAAGWTLAARSPQRVSAPDVVRTLQPGTPVRMVVGDTLIAARFFEATEVGGRSRIRVGSSSWHLDTVDYLAPAPLLSDDRFGRVRLAPAGSMVSRTGHAGSWIAEQCAGSAGSVIIGTKTWLMADMELGIAWGDPDEGFDRLEDILRPDDGRRPSWASAIVSTQLFDSANLPNEANLSVFDGASAVQWLADVQTPRAVALVDRGSPDAFATDSIMQLRSMGLPVSLDTIGWAPPDGVEAVAFEVHR